MADLKGQKLFVNMGASQARRRLKGFGHGVRKIQTAGRNQAVVIHTATGDHLRELEKQFADVGYSQKENDLQQPIDNLRNLGRTTAAWLREIGISTVSDLEQRGAVQAYRLLKQQQPQVTLNLLWALAAGLQDLDYRELTDEAKKHLRQQLNRENEA